MSSSQTEAKQTRVMTAQEWINKWENNTIGFHQHNIHRLLVEFLDVMLNKKSKARILFPLCGKALDMKWLADMGHNIVGIDVSEIGLKDFFEEQKIPYVEEAVPEIPGGKVFKSTCGNISLYCCNIFDLSDKVVGKFDGIWDRGALVAVNPSDRERYSKTMLQLMNKDCRYLAVTVGYDVALVKGPPFYVSDADLQSLMGSLCDIQLLKAVDALTDTQRDWGLDFFEERIHLITLKANS
ncbi:thiopurine S-methyltransferase [Discoglossus pictus]